MCDTIVKYYEEPFSTNKPKEFKVESVGHWLVSHFNNKPKPEGLRIFKGSISELTDITDEIKDAPTILLETSGIYSVTILPKGGSVTGVLNIIGAVLIVRSLQPEIPSLPTANVNRSQQSPNNSLGNRQNIARVNQRFADIRGKDVSIPDLLMIPYRKFIANEEYEYIYGSISTGRVLVEDVRDGITLISDITGAQASIYNPNTSPNSGDAPVTEIGGPINERIFNVTQSNEIDGAVLTSPNRLDQGGSGVVGPVQGLSGAGEAWVNLVAQNGLYEQSATDFISLSAVFSITIRELNSSNVPTGVNTVTSVTLSANPLGRTRVAAMTVELAIPYTRYTIEALRTSNSDLEFQGTVVDEVRWRDLYFVNGVSQTDFGDITSIHAVVRNTDAALRIKERKINCRATRLERVWDNSNQVLTGTLAASENFADAIVGLTLDPLVGRRTIADIDLANIYQVQAEVLSHFSDNADSIKVGHTFDSTKISYEQSIALIADACFCGVFQVGNRIKMYFRGPQMMSAALFNHSNKIPSTDTRRRSFTREENYDGVELTYRDIDQDLDITIRVPNNNLVNPKIIELLGCPNEFIAIRRAYREWNNVQYRSISYSFESFGMGRLLRPGQRIDNVNNTIAKTTNGDIIGVDGLNIVTSSDLVFVSGSTYIILLQHRNGTVESIPVTQGALPNSAVLMRAPLQSLQAGFDESRTKYIFGENTSRNATLQLIDSVESTINNNDERVTISTINYDERYWQNDNNIPSQI